MAATLGTGPRGSARRPGHTGLVVTSLLTLSLAISAIGIASPAEVDAGNAPGHSVVHSR